MTNECIILAGGFGTRLRDEVPELPKVMAPVLEQPFLSYVFNWLKKNNIKRVILSLGYRSEDIIEWCDSNEKDLELVYSVEPEPLGTGGAILQAMQQIHSADVFVVNGDTLFDVDLTGMARYHHQKKAELSLALKPMEQFERYGSVKINQDERITGFEEKKFQENGLINGGVYLINTDSIKALNLPVKFSFEKEFLEIYFEKLSTFGFIQERYFIDIGIPDDYHRAQRELGKFKN